MTLNPGGIIAWIIIGLIAGWAAGRLVRGSGFGIIGDVVVGLIGALIGGFVFSAFGFQNAGFWWSLLVAFVGAVILVWILRLITGGEQRRRAY